ncbi:hypothetical protein HanRHA438_Chr07g0296331 [Helianthus annuus]|uniref:Uncharacterized protein n=1 Tax=Helianthus annuus TaxID=4232 RepID=A0A9K3IJ66_HELAN|nr:hypothetical protein HanXRQr2_Chr07g0285751 [Helianthus annuus]KAJ0549537.1 hypothetical protein HanHA300_Chr07g0234921 [Helianthus annuus]KAJ0555949.1 hypothetical protein HanIR_Chr07g0308111 [Helianthus annuus]KAJ0562492.1 hypothetical protein HanHA89_Chr07g0252101 [Helianthus annuus]KAJ0727868.1 hypothetical protein HanLR1_Chr07g0234871 [Helianthus annuus]
METKILLHQIGVIPLKMEFRGTDEIPLETMDAPVDEVWYQDIISIQLPERALVAAKMSLLWRADRLDKPVYMEGVVLYAVAYKLWGILHFPRTKICRRNLLLVLKRRAAPATTVPKKADMPKADVPKAEKKKGMCLVSDSWCNYIAVSDSLEGLALIGLRKPKAEPQVSADIPASNPDDPIDLDSSPEPLKRLKADKRKRPEGGAAAQPVTKMARKKIGKKGNLDAFAAKFSPEKTSALVQTDTLFSFSDDRVPSPPPELNKENLEGEKIVEKEAETTGVDTPKPASPTVVMVTTVLERGKTIVDEPPIVIAPSASAHTSEPSEGNVKRDEDKIEHQESEVHDTEEESPIRPNETPGDYYYRLYTEKKPTDLHTPVWKLKQGDTFSNYQVCREWFQGAFPHTEIKFQEEQTHERIYRAYLQETASASSTSHRIMREWRSMQKEWEAFEASKKEIAIEKAQMVVLKTKLEANKAKFEDEQKPKEWSAVGWKKKAEAEAALLEEERKR